MSDFKYTHGLCIMRAQPFHIGHQKLVDRMLSECEHVTIALGSIQEHGTNRNPFNYTTRKKMIQNIYQAKPEYKRLKIVGIFDINNPAEWGNYVLDFITESFSDLPKPDVYYAGSVYDAHWFKSCIANIIIEDRADESFPFVSGSMIRDMIRYGDKRWKNFIAPINHPIIEDFFTTEKGII